MAELTLREKRLDKLAKAISDAMSDEFDLPLIVTYYGAADALIHIEKWEESRGID